MAFRSFMDQALAEAVAAEARGEVPVGAVVVAPNGAVVAAAGNRTREHSDPTAHAEILALRQACLIAGSDRLTDHDLWVTLEPCAMCAAAISAARIRRLYFGAEDPKSGGVFYGARVFAHAQAHHVPEIYDGIGASASQRLLEAFFDQRRKSGRN